MNIKRTRVIDLAFRCAFLFITGFASASAVVVISLGRRPWLGLTWLGTACAAACVTANVIAAQRRFDRDDKEWERKMAAIDDLIKGGKIQQAERAVADAQSWAIRRAHGA